MNKETFNQKLPQMTDSSCEQAEQLIAYLYAEATEAEAERFEQHLAQCAGCAEEMAAFGHMRKAVSAWRNAALSAATSLPAFEASSADVSNNLSRPVLKRSARAAIREFFNFAPLWLRAGGAVAATVVCALAILGAVNAELRWDSSGIALSMGKRTPREQVVTPEDETPVEPTYTAEQVDRMVAERVAQQRVALIAELKERTSTPAPIAASSRKEASPASTGTTLEVAERRRPRRSSLPSALPRNRQPLSRGIEDEPQLYDLLGEVDE